MLYSQSLELRNILGKYDCWVNDCLFSKIDMYSPKTPVSKMPPYFPGLSVYKIGISTPVVILPIKKRTYMKNGNLNP